MSELLEGATTTPDTALLSWARGCHRGNGGMVLVAPGLYLGDKQAGADHERLQRAGVSAVCAVGAKTGTAPGVVYHHVPVKDDGVSSMLPFLDSACAFVHEQRQWGAVLVHCKGGINRSPCLVVAYLMKFEQLTLHEALELCSLARPAARCPANFRSDLETLARECERRTAESLELSSQCTECTDLPSQPSHQGAPM
eukprot:Skav222830  [mRNA]  locus=scaffold4760:118763:119353:+ [translate_table: standard]